MSYHKFVQKCRNTHKGMRRDTSGRALAVSHRAACGNNIRFCRALTEKQQALYEGTNPSPRKRDVVELIMKFEHFEMLDDAAKMYDMYGYMFHEVHEGDPSPEEAAAILDALTPDDLK